MSCLTAQNLKKVDAERQRKLDLMNKTINKLIAETPRMISIEIYVRNIAQQAYVYGWNNRADDEANKEAQQ